MVECESGQLTEAEAQQYDRQIRLWGLESQKRLRGAKVLIIGLGGLGAETAKNIILSGVKSVTLLDHKNATEADMVSQFFIPFDKLGENRAELSVIRAQTLNPLVEVTADKRNVAELPEDFFSSPRWNVIVATGLPISQYVIIDEVCRKNKIKFFAGDVFGMFGFTFSDLIDHNYLEDIVTYIQRGSKSIKTVKQEVSFPSLKEALDVDFTKDFNKSKLRRMEYSYFVMNILMKFRTDFNRDPTPSKEDMDVLLGMRNKECFTLSLPNEKMPDELFAASVGPAMAPVCAIVGAVLAQEIIKAISLKDPPHKNMYFFDPIKNMGHVQLMAATN